MEIAEDRGPQDHPHLDTSCKSGGYPRALSVLIIHWKDSELTES